VAGEAAVAEATGAAVAAAGGAALAEAVILAEAAPGEIGRFVIRPWSFVVERLGSGQRTTDEGLTGHATSICSIH
jgi:hypothetical protein